MSPKTTPSAPRTSAARAAERAGGALGPGGRTAGWGTVTAMSPRVSGRRRGEAVQVCTSGVQMPSRSADEAVPDAGIGANEPACAVRLDLAAEVAHVRPQRPDVLAVGRPPDL